jgi:hypothetical protein
MKEKIKLSCLGNLCLEEIFPPSEYVIKKINDSDGSFFLQIFLRGCCEVDSNV